MKKKIVSVISLILCVLTCALCLVACGGKNGTYYAYDKETGKYDKESKLVIDGKKFTMYEMGEKVAEGDFKTKGKNFTATMKQEGGGISVEIKIEGTVAKGVITVKKTTMSAMGQTETDDTVGYFCKEGKKP